MKKLEDLTHPIKNIDDLEKALEARLEAFLKVGARASDIALESVYAVSDKKDADKVLKNVIKGKKPTERDSEVFKGYLTYFLMKIYANTLFFCAILYYNIG